MIANKMKFSFGIGLLASFMVVLALLFSPIINGENGLNYLDSLFNSISKDSANYFPEVREAAIEFSSNEIDVTLKLDSEKQVEQAAKLFEQGGAIVQAEGKALTVRGTIGRIMDNCLEDSESMYNNDGTKISSKYNLNERLVLYNWHMTLKAMKKDLNRQKKFNEAKFIGLTIKKAVDLSYNYYEIEPQSLKSSLEVVIFALLFYVIYTLWFGFAILFMFEGWGMKLEH